ncbi:MAG: hypothetical protein JNL97_17645, partial [Verrucomicrobiales bacterium]|nr:hypothetical protein [Verrucomicrobiales bacterium]
MRRLDSRHLLPLLCAAYFVVLAPWTPGFATADNLRTIVAYVLPLLVVSVGLTLVLVVGGIDLSVTSTIALASVIGGKIMSAEEGWLAGQAWAVPAAVLAMLTTGAAIGAANGWAVTVCRIPPFIATLGTLMVVNGLALWITQSRKIGGLPATFLSLGQHLGMAAGIAGLAAIVAHLGL